MSYDYLHNYRGFTKTKPSYIDVYDADFNMISVKKDSDNTLYDIENHRWVNDISEMNVFKKLQPISVYTGEDMTVCQSYSNSLYNDTPSYVEFNSSMESLSYLYNNFGITLHMCMKYYVKNGVTLVWFDSETSKYWDNREDFKCWSFEPPDVNESDLFTKCNLEISTFSGTQISYTAITCNKMLIDRE